MAKAKSSTGRSTDAKGASGAKFSGRATPKLAYWCFDTLEAKLARRKKPLRIPPDDPLW